MIQNRFQMGMIGLGTMGRNLLLNMSDHGLSVVGYDVDPDRVRELRAQAGDSHVAGTQSIEELVKWLEPPRTIMMLVPAGRPVDDVIHSVLPLLEPGDVLIDGGNSHFIDTQRRQGQTARTGVHLLGVGVSGGEKGARCGPSLMPGGDPEAYERVRTVLEAISARVDDEPCVAYLGPGAAGHYVKMVHNGIEYAIIQLIAESYDLMKRGLGMNDDELHEVFDAWDQEELNAYLIEIAADVFSHADDRTNKRLIDVILDRAKQKGTGMWAVQDAMELQVPVPTIDMAVSMRDLSRFGDERAVAARCLSGPHYRLRTDRETFLGQLANSLHMGMLIAYAQGMALLRQASSTYKFCLNLKTVARIWRGGCIIRSAFLKNIQAAFGSQPDLPNLMMDPRLAPELIIRQESLRALVVDAVNAGIPVPAFMATLAYFDAYRSAWLPANLIQALRDYFGSHTYERIDARGVFHTEWQETRCGDE